METYAKIEKCQKQIQGIVTYETYIRPSSHLMLNKKKLIVLGLSQRACVRACVRAFYNILCYLLFLLCERVE
jgi:hypothetical protein